jgi:hypothetical protein
LIKIIFPIIEDAKETRTSIGKTHATILLLSGSQTAISLAYITKKITNIIAVNKINVTLVTPITDPAIYI